MLNLQTLAEQTSIAVENNIRVFQIHRFAEDDFSHIQRLERWAEFPIGSRIADMGCGIVEVSVILKILRPDCSFCLINISEEQLLYAPPEIPKHTCSFLNVPEPDETFDAVLFCFSIGHEDHKQAIEEAYRLLKPNGILFIYDMVRISGDNKNMEGLHYNVWPRNYIESIATNFYLDYYMEPSDNGKYGKEILGEEYEKFFKGTIPAIWRFIKRKVN